MGYTARSYLKHMHIFRLSLNYIYDNQPKSTVPQTPQQCPCTKRDS